MRTWVVFGAALAGASVAVPRDAAAQCGQVMVSGIEGTCNMGADPLVYLGTGGCNGGTPSHDYCQVTGCPLAGCICGSSVYCRYVAGCTSCDPVDRCDGRPSQGSGSAALDEDCGGGDPSRGASGGRSSAGGAGGGGGAGRGGGGHPDAPCTGPECACEASRGDPVMVGSGHAMLDPISIVNVAGPWDVPLTFELFYSAANGWGPLREEAATPQIHEENYLGPGWSHTFSEAIAVFQTVSSTESRIDPATVSWPSGSTAVCGPLHLSSYRFVYRQAGGRAFEHTFATTPSGEHGVGCVENAGLPSTDLTLASQRGEPYALHVLNRASGPPTFELDDLRTGVITTFDTHGRVTAKVARTSSTGRFGWHVTYDSNGSLYRVDHDSGWALHFTPFLGGTSSFPIPLFSAVGLHDPSQSSGVSTPYAAIWRNLLHTAAGATVTGVSMSQIGAAWAFTYDTPSGGGPNSLRMTSAVDPYGVTHMTATYPPAPTSCVLSGPVRNMALSWTDRDSRWEFRRTGTAFADQVCSGSTAVTATTPQNPCATAGSNPGIAVLNLNTRQQTSGFAPVTCNITHTNQGDSDCNTSGGFLCSQGAYPDGFHYCVRFDCQEAPSVHPDQPTAISNGCGTCSNAAQITWSTMAGGSGTEGVRRITARRWLNGRYTSYAVDGQGRVVEECENDSDTDATTCSSPAIHHAWTYANTGIVPWAVTHYEHTSLYGLMPGVTPPSSNPSVDSTYDSATGHLTRTTETGTTYVSWTGTEGTQTRVTDYTYSSTTGAVTQVWGPHASGLSTPGATDPVTTYTLNGTTATTASNQVSEVRVRRVASPVADLVTSFTSYSRVGAPTSVTTPDGVTTQTTYDAQDRTATVLRPEGTYTVTYDTRDRISAVHAPTNNTTVYTYTLTTDRRPSRITQTNSASLDGSSHYTGSMTDGVFVDEPTDPALAVWDLTRGQNSVSGAWYRETHRRDDRGRPAAVTNTALTTSTTYGYDAATRRLASVTDGLGRVSTYSYDNFDRVTQVTRDQGTTNATTTFTYAGTFGQPISIQAPNSSTTNYWYDDFGRRVKSAGADIGTVRSRYDERDALIDQGEAEATHTTRTYDPAGRLTSVTFDVEHTPSGLTGNRRYFYDALPTGYTCPVTGACSNLAGHLAVDESDTMSPTYRTYYGYDTAGRVTSESIQVGSSSVWTTTYEYTTTGLLKSIRYPLNSGDVARYTYNDSAQPGSAEAVVVLDSYIETNYYRRLVDSVTRRPAGPIDGLWYNQHGANPVPTNASIARGLNADGSTNSVVWSTGLNTTADLWGPSYSYNGDGAIASIQQGVSSTDNFYQYDRLGRLTCASSGFVWGACTSSSSGLLGLYQYDTTGNRTSWTNGSTPTGHTLSYPSSSTNRPSSWTRSGWTQPMTLQWGSGTYLGGAPGQRMSESRATDGTNPAVARYYGYWFGGGPPDYVFDSDGRGYNSTQYGYDARGRRVWSIAYDAYSNRTDTRYFYDYFDRLIAAVTTYAPVPSYYEYQIFFWVDNEVVFRYVLTPTYGEERDFIYNDHLGTPRNLVAVSSSMASPTVVYRAPREPFLAGPPALAPSGANAPFNMRFPGQWSDDATQLFFSPSTPVATEMPDLVNHQARAYDPGLGGYSAAEPLFARTPGSVASTLQSRTPLVGSLGLPFSGYAGSNPVMAIDSGGQNPLLGGLGAGVLTIGGFVLGVYAIYSGAAAGYWTTHPPTGLPPFPTWPSSGDECTLDRIQPIPTPEEERTRCIAQCNYFWLSERWGTNRSLLEGCLVACNERWPEGRPN